MRAEIIENITEWMIEVYGGGIRDTTWVVIEDVKPADWPIGDKVPALKTKCPIDDGQLTIVEISERAIGTGVVCPQISAKAQNKEK
jgi:phenylpyruvate tautomerase PptA (4-oxalocrotonate tautomerase family)